MAAGIGTTPENGIPATLRAPTEMATFIGLIGLFWKSDDSYSAAPSRIPFGIEIQITTTFKNSCFDKGCYGSKQNVQPWNAFLVVT